jgi:photosystem II stability/assembly factor-like uncharacterized protein
MLSFNLSSQNNIKGKSISLNKIKEKEIVALSLDSGKYFVSLVDQNMKPYYSNKIPDSLLKSSGNPIENIDIHFLDKQYGFVFGNEVGYAFYPFILKTENGGKTWQRQLFSNGAIGSPILSDNFFMFDKQKGITIANWGDESKFNYYITEDGGKTWKNKSFDISDKEFRVLNAPNIQKVIFNQSGEVTVILFDFDLQRFRDNKVMFFKSKDFGNTFEMID